MLILVVVILFLSFVTYYTICLTCDRANAAQTYAKWTYDEIHVTADRIEQLEIGQRALIEAAEAAALRE